MYKRQVQARTSAKEFFNADERLADLGLIAVPGAEELTAKIDRHLLRWAQEAGMVIRTQIHIILFI